jgi:hypothetical protein
MGKTRHEFHNRHESNSRAIGDTAETQRGQRVAEVGRWKLIFVFSEAGQRIFDPNSEVGRGVFTAAVLVAVLPGLGSWPDEDPTRTGQRRGGDIAPYLQRIREEWRSLRLQL